MKTKRLKLLWVGAWEPILFWLAGLLVVGGLLFFKLGSLTPNLSSPEIMSHAASSNIRLIINNPLNGPYKLLIYALNRLHYVNAFSLRAVSATFGLITIWLFYYVVSRWHDRRTAIIGTLLFASSAWFLHFARLAVPDVTLLLLISALAYGHWIRKTKRSASVGIIGILIAVGLLYIPGLIWFVLIGGLWQSRQIGNHLKETKLSIPLVIALGAVLLAPLAIAITRQPALLKSLAGLPATGLASPVDIIRHTLGVLLEIFFRGPKNPVIWLGQLPLLDIFAASMCLLGIYTYSRHRQLDRTKLLASAIILGTILVGLRGPVSIIILAPFIYLLITAGVAWLLNQWLSVFPRNPLAKWIGVSLIVIAVALACFYNLRHYYVAWPDAPATKHAYRQRI